MKDKLYNPLFQKRMNVSPIHVSTVEHVWMEFITLLVFVQARSMEGDVKVQYYVWFRGL